jgi:hypothetical protein
MFNLTVLLRVLLNPTILWPTITVLLQLTSAVELNDTVAIAVAEPYHNSEVGDVAAGVVAGCPGSFGQRWKPTK